MNLLDSSFVCFVYPFAFDDESFERRLEAIDAAPGPGGGEFWHKRRFPVDEFLPHVARYLNPRDNTPATAAAWQLDGNALQSLRGLGAGAHNRNVRWTMSYNKKEIEFRIAKAELALFRVGVGCLSITASPAEMDADTWHDFLHYFRFCRGQRGVKIGCTKRVGKASGGAAELQPFFPEVAGGLNGHADGRGTLQDILHGLLKVGELESDGGPWWRETFVAGQLIPFAGLLYEGVEKDDLAAVVYRARNFFHARQEIHLTESDLALTGPSLHPYSERQWFTFSLEGTAFVAINPPDTAFFRETLPNHLATQYYLLFLLVLHQRFALIELSDEVASHWLTRQETSSSRVRDRAFQRMYQKMLAFTARGHFAQVAQREHHHRCYTKWQESFEIDALYREVNDEVRDMHDFLQSQQARRLEQRINLLAVLFGVPGLIVGFLGINLYGVTSGAEGMNLWVAMSVTFAVGLGVGALLLTKMRP